MAEPFLLAQLSDPHIGADWISARDPATGLAAAVQRVAALQPDAVLVTGDLVENRLQTEYDEVRALLAPLDGPLHVVCGNHDDRGLLRAAFDLPGDGADFIQYSADIGPLRLVAVDTTRPGEDPGELDAGRLDWLDAELAAAPAAPTVLAMHHPPLLSGIPVMDEIPLPDADRRALADVLERHPQVCRIVAGHMHRTIAGELAGRAVLAAPSTYAQIELDFEAHEYSLSDGPGGFAVHALVDGDLLSHVEVV